MKNLNKLSNLKIVTGLAAFLAVVTAVAGAPANRSMTVSLAGLDLETAQGRSEAQARVHVAASRLCGQLADMDDLSRHENYLKCVDSSITAALQQIRLLPGMVAKRD